MAGVYIWLRGFQDGFRDQLDQRFRRIPFGLQPPYGQEIDRVGVAHGHGGEQRAFRVAVDAHFDVVPAHAQDLLHRRHGFLDTEHVGETCQTGPVRADPDLLHRVERAGPLDDLVDFCLQQQRHGQGIVAALLDVLGYRDISERHFLRQDRQRQTEDQRAHRDGQTQHQKLCHRDRLPASAAMK